MTPRQKEEIESIPIGHMMTIKAKLRAVGPERTEELLSEYEERLAIICEGREATPEDVSAAWAGVLHLRDLMPVMKDEEKC